MPAGYISAKAREQRLVEVKRPKARTRRDAYAIQAMWLSHGLSERGGVEVSARLFCIGIQHAP